MMLRSFYLLLLIVCSLVLAECGRHRSSSLARYSSQLSSLVQASTDPSIAQSASCFNPSGTLYDAVQTLPDTMIVAQFLKMDEFKHLAEIIQNPDAGLTFLVPTDESIYNTLSLHYNSTCKESNPVVDELIAQIGDKTIECKKLDLMVRMTGLMAAMGKKMKSLHKKAFTAPLMAKRSQEQQPLKSKEAPCPANTPCPAGASTSGGSSQLVAAPIESAPAGGDRKHLLCSSPSLRRDALLKLCDQLGVRPDDFNLTFSAIDIQASTANFLYSLIEGTQTTNQFSPINIFPTLLDDPAIVRLNLTDPTKNKQMILIQASDDKAGRYRVVYGIPSNDYSWYSPIIRPNLRTSNGVLHVIDGPLHAPANPIFSLAHAKFNDFLSMALESGLAPMLGNKPATTLFVPVESATKLIKKAFGFESNDATFQSMLKNELIAQLNDILAMAKLKRYSMSDATTISGEERIVANQPLAIKLMQKARTTSSDAFSLPQMSRHSMLASKFDEMAHHEKQATLMVRNATAAGFPAAYDPSQYWNMNYLQNLDQLRQIAQQFIAECVNRFGAEGGRPSIYINPRSSTGIIPEETPATPSRPSTSPLYSQTHRPRFGMPMAMKSKDGSIEVPMQGWQYRLNRPSLIKGHIMAAVDHLFAHEKILSQPLFDNWNRTQTYADFINLHTFDGVFYTNTFEDGLTLQSMQGQLFTIKNSTEGVFGGVGDNWKIDQSNVIFPNIITSNGVIHIIDQPLGINLLPTNIIRQLLQQSPVLRSVLTEKPTSRGLLGLLGPCPSPALKSLKAKAFPAKKKAVTPAMPVKRDDDDDFDLFGFDDYDFDFDFDDDDEDYLIPSSLTSDQQATMITIRSITEIIAKIAPRRGDEMINVCGEELPSLPTQPSIVTIPPVAEKKDVITQPTKPTTIPAIPAGKIDIKPTVDVKPSVTHVPQPTPAPAPAPLAPTPTPAELKCPPLDQVCVVNDPMLYSSPKPICYNPKTHLCLNNNFLCPHTAPNVCGRACFDQAIYSCEAFKEQPFASKLLLKKDVEAEIKKAKEAKPKEITAKVPETKPAEPAKLKPILDALAQMKLKQPTQPKVQTDPSTKPILDALEQMKAKQTPPVQQKVQTPPSSKPIIDVLTDPSLLQTSPQTAKVAKPVPQPVIQQPIKVNVTKPRN